ncbi:hypothetical protein YYC_01162 [Plasmodium yoelii 17X]|uniref:CIR protein n=1 Tax=Plasmodium yoelii 17X TaxID=1323249 RepID=V7PSX3_PLAYE|nr:hypothetical protein YYC_01162 [Plasmodium yoelii 17X]
MPKDMCMTFYKVNRLFNKEKFDLNIINSKDGPFIRYCPYHRESEKYECKNVYDGVNALSMHLFTELHNLPVDKMKMKSRHKQYTEYIMMWICYKLFQTDDYNYSTLFHFYKKYLTNAFINYDHMGKIYKNRYLKDASIEYMSRLYELLNEICNITLKYSRNALNINQTIIDSTKIYDMHQELYNDIKECDTYVYLLNNLKTEYENFKKSLTKKSRRRHLNSALYANSKDLITTRELDETYKPGFNSDGCIKAHSNVKKKFPNPALKVPKTPTHTKDQKDQKDQKPKLSPSEQNVPSKPHTTITKPIQNGVSQSPKPSEVPSPPSPPPPQPSYQPKDNQPKAPLAPTREPAAPPNIPTSSENRTKLPKTQIKGSNHKHGSDGSNIDPRVPFNIGDNKRGISGDNGGSSSGNINPGSEENDKGPGNRIGDSPSITSNDIDRSRNKHVISNMTRSKEYPKGGKQRNLGNDIGSKSNRSRDSRGPINPNGQINTNTHLLPSGTNRENPNDGSPDGRKGSNVGPGTTDSKSLNTGDGKDGHGSQGSQGSHGGLEGSGGLNGGALNTDGRQDGRQGGSGGGSDGNQRSQKGSGGSGSGTDGDQRSPKESGSSGSGTEPANDFQGGQGGSKADHGGSKFDHSGPTGDHSGPTGDHSGPTGNQGGQTSNQGGQTSNQGGPKDGQDGQKDGQGGSEGSKDLGDGSSSEPGKLGNKQDGSGNDQDPPDNAPEKKEPQNTPGKPLETEPFSLNIIFNGMEKINNTFKFYERYKEKIIHISNDIHDVYNTTLDNIKTGFDKSINFFNEIIENINIDSKKVENSDHSDDKKPGADGTGDKLPTPDDPPTLDNPPTPPQEDPDKKYQHQTDHHQTDQDKTDQNRTDQNQEGPIKSPLKEGQPQEGSPQGGPLKEDPLKGGSPKGSSPQGSPHQESPHQGSPHQGNPHQGNPHQGNPHQGNPHQGSTPKDIPKEKQSQTSLLPSSKEQTGTTQLSQDPSTNKHSDKNDHREPQKTVPAPVSVPVIKPRNTVTETKGNGTIGIYINVLKKYKPIGIAIMVLLIPITLLIVYKYFSSGWKKELKRKKNMKKVINLFGVNKKTKTVINSTYGKKQVEIIINSSAPKKEINKFKKFKKSINSVYGKKSPLLNMYKLMQADPAPFISLFFLLIFFVYKRKKDSLE